MKALVTQSWLTLHDPMDYRPLGSSVYGILQARILEWLAMPSSRGSSPPRDGTQVSCIAGRFLTVWATRKALYCRGGFKAWLHILWHPLFSTSSSLQILLLCCPLPLPPILPFPPLHKCREKWWNKASWTPELRLSFFCTFSILILGSVHRLDEQVSNLPEFTMQRCSAPFQ